MKYATILAFYYLTLLVFLVASFLPQYRLWGLSIWAYLPSYAPFLLFGLGAAMPIIVRYASPHGLAKSGAGRPVPTDNMRYLIISACLAVWYGLVFWLLRVRTHFLGDGLTSLSYLASDNPLFKTRELGETLIHIWLKSALGGNPKQSALLSFQIISIAAGMMFLILAVLTARSLFDRTRDRFLFVAGTASGGYMLLFFGYVEYYSMFVMSVAAFSLIGLLIVKGKLNRWIIVPVLGLATFFHVLGLTLAASAVYVLMVNSGIGKRLSQLSRKTKVLSVILAAVMAAAVFSYYYRTSYFFQFAFVPLIENRFTADSYTLFSVKHLLDFLNLLMLLLPALPFFFVALLFLPIKSLTRRREYRFLGVLLLSVLAAAFIFDPKMGMPRDWDLFSFAGIPLALSFYFVILDNRERISAYVEIGILSIVLGIFSLSARVVTHNVFEASVAQFEHYIASDKNKCAKGRSFLMNYYYDTGDPAKAEIEKAKWYAEVPEKGLFMNAFSLRERNVVQAMALFRRITEMNPVWQDAWVNLASCYFDMRNFDSAIFFTKIALGINPYDRFSWNNLGAAYMYVEDYASAEKALLRSISLDNANLEPHTNLITLYSTLYRPDKLFRYLQKAATKKDSPAIVFQKLGDYYLNKTEFQKAAETYSVALQKGLDSTYVQQLLESHPQLRQWFDRPYEAVGSTEGRK
jgi:tetratricopeptide (TPR) repeat protein